VAIAHTSLAGTTIPPDAGHLPPDRNVTEPAKATVPVVYPRASVCRRRCLRRRDHGWPL